MIILFATKRPQTEELITFFFFFFVIQLLTSLWSEQTTELNNNVH